MSSADDPGDGFAPHEEPHPIASGNVSIGDVAATEFFVRCRTNDPCKSWIKSPELVAPLGFSDSRAAGIALAALAADDDGPLAIEERSGYRRTAYGVTRRDDPDDVPPARLWELDVDEEGSP